MACYHPVRGYRSRQLNENGKRPIVFKVTDGFLDMPVDLPCGQCIGCRLEKSRQWAVRCVHEAQLHEANSFLTLTFDNDSLGEQDSLVKSDFQNFMKRLRNHTGGGIRYFHCGEYGELLNRPHHHAIIFGYTFPDQSLLSTRNDIPLYHSATLNEIWGHGFCSIGEVNFETAAYVARYTLKKKTGKESEAYYGDRLPPYNSMSLKPGIAQGWLEKFQGDVYPSDEVIIRKGIKCKPPKYYDKIFDIQNPSAMVKIKKRRNTRARERASDSTPERLQVKEDLKYIQTKELRRTYEE